jgi:hypothetical protein
MGQQIRLLNVRFGSGTDILGTSANVRFTPQSGHSTGSQYPPTVMTDRKTPASTHP